MELKLRRVTQETIREVFKAVSYHSKPMKRVTNVDISKVLSLPDSLLIAYYKNDNNRAIRLAGICEHIAKKVSNSCDIGTRT